MVGGRIGHHKKCPRPSGGEEGFRSAAQQQTGQQQREEDQYNNGATNNLLMHGCSIKYYVVVKSVV